MFHVLQSWDIPVFVPQRIICISGEFTNSKEHNHSNIPCDLCFLALHILTIASRHRHRHTPTPYFICVLSYMLSASLLTCRHYDQLCLHIYCQMLCEPVGLWGCTWCTPHHCSSDSSSHPSSCDVFCVLHSVTTLKIAPLRQSLTAREPLLQLLPSYLRCLLSTDENSLHFHLHFSRPSIFYFKNMCDGLVPSTLESLWIKMCRGRRRRRWRRKRQGWGERIGGEGGRRGQDKEEENVRGSEASLCPAV